MHYRYLVTLNRDRATNSQDARFIADDTLLAEGFCNTGLLWSGGRADWFVIGGRWSGELSRHSWAKPVYKLLDYAQENEGVVLGTSYSDPEKQRKVQDLSLKFGNAWRAVAPRAYRGIPYPRDLYEPLGYEDDAMLLTRELYDALLKPFEGETETEDYADLDCDTVTPDMIDHKWLVVVDYHI